MWLKKFKKVYSSLFICVSSGISIYTNKVQYGSEQHFNQSPEYYCQNSHLLISYTLRRSVFCFLCMPLQEKLYGKYTLGMLHLYFRPFKPNKRMLQVNFLDRSINKYKDRKKIKRYLVYTSITLHLYFLNFLKWKLVSTIFYQIFIFSQNDSSLRTVKNVFYFIKKALFVLEIFNFL